MMDLLSAHHEQCPACKQMTLRVVVDPMTVEGRRILGCENRCDWENPPVHVPVTPIIEASVERIEADEDVTAEVKEEEEEEGEIREEEVKEVEEDVAVIEEEISMEESVKLMSRCRLLVRRAMRAEWPGTDEYVAELEEIEQRRSGSLGREDQAAVEEMIGELESALGSTQDVINKILDKLVVMKRDQLTKLEKWMRKNLLKEEDEEEKEEGGQAREAGGEQMSKGEKGDEGDEGSGEEDGRRRNAGRGGFIGGRPRKNLEQMRATRMNVIQQALSSGLLGVEEVAGLDEMSLADMDRLCQKIRMRAYKRRWADA